MNLCPPSDNPNLKYHVTILRSSITEPLLNYLNNLRKKNITQIEVVYEEYGRICIWFMSEAEAVAFKLKFTYV